MDRRMQAFATGASLGAAAGLATGIWQDLDLPAALFRAFLLALATGWMGMLLAWLDALLPRDADDRDGLHDGA